MSAPSEPQPDAPARGTPPRRRSLPVQVAATILFLFAALAVVVGVSGVVGGGSRDPESAGDAEYLATQAIVMTVLATCYVVLGLQLWRGRRWAQVTTVVLLGVTGFLALGNATSDPGSLFGAAVALVVVVLLVAPPSARGHFRNPNNRQRSVPPPPRWRR